MNATPININPAQAAPTQPTAGRQQDSAAPEMSFSQTLSREIAQSRKNGEGRQDAGAQSGEETAPQAGRPAEAGPDAAAHARADEGPAADPLAGSAADATASPDILLALPFAEVKAVSETPTAIPGTDVATSPDALLAASLAAAVPVDALPAVPAAKAEGSPEAASALPAADAKAAPEIPLALPVNPVPAQPAPALSASLAAEHAANPAPNDPLLQGARKSRALQAAQADGAADPARGAARGEPALSEKAAPPAATAGAAGAFPAQLAAAARQADAVRSGEFLPDLAGNPAMRPAAQAVLEALQVPGDPAAPRLSPAVGTPAWGQALGEKIVWMATAAQQTATLTLNPPNMGPLQIVLDISDAQATASFFSAQPEVRQALEASLPRLREMMSDAGIQLGQASVSADTPRQNETPGDRGHRATPAFAGRDDAVASGQQAVRMPAPRAGRGLVDTFA